MLVTTFVHTLCLEIYFIWYQYSQSCPLMFNVFMVYIFHPLIFNWTVPLYLKCISYRQYQVRSCFFIHSNSLCLFIGVYSPWYLIILILLDLGLPFYYLFFIPFVFVCFASHFLSMISVVFRIPFQFINWNVAVCLFCNSDCSRYWNIHH